MVEGAPGGGTKWRRALAGRGGEGVFAMDTWQGRAAGEQADCVRVAWGIEEAPSIGHFNDLAHIHHSYTITYLLYKAQVMGDEQEGQAKVFIEVQEEIDDL